MATPYTFTQPIRYYKANDPYYYEVDNIPLRQLEENILYVKDKLAGAGGGGRYLTENSEISIYKIKELKPTVVGPRTVKVNAGRFVSRINDAFDIPFPLNYLTATYANDLPILPDLKQLVGVTPPEIDRDAIWNKFINKSSNPANINGLTYTFTFHNTPGAMGSHWRTKTGSDRHYSNFPQYEGAGDSSQFAWPGSQIYDMLTPQYLGQLIGFDQGNYISTNLPLIHLAFVQMWRGVFRTSVVDFGDSTIEIPSWSDDDFYYYDDDGNKVQIDNVNQRIDLLVGYSLPIDSSGTAINNYEEGYCDDLDNAPVPQKMTVPTLGLVRGAGLGIQKHNTSNPVGITTLEGCGNPGVPGSPRILANQNDANINANTGITTIKGNKIHGSFPSPDDLLNLAPNLALNVEADNLQLIGQAALPIAYIVVKKGVSSITQEDIIDIRPFLRTTEFTYNERAGVAAANPPLSLANPAVGAYQLQDAINKLEKDIDADDETMRSGRAIYTDYVMGGLAFGVEGTMLTMCDAPQGAQDPFGSESYTKAFTSPGDNNSYAFTDFKSSKLFLESEDKSKRDAFLEYIYAERQDDLKIWLADPNTPIASNQGLTYLGLPAGGGGRNIPLYPEWDMPVDDTNLASYDQMLGNTTAATPRNSPQPTWWMWIEAINGQRPLAYVPGAVISQLEGNDHSYLTRRYGFGNMGTAKDRKPVRPLGSASIVTVSKGLQVTFPSWVADYDVLVEYVNCGPVTHTADGWYDYRPQHAQYGLGCGLMVNKGALTQFNQSLVANITINSVSQPFPMYGDGFHNLGYVNNGRLADEEGGTAPGAMYGGGFGVAPMGVTNKLWQNLSYTVCLPQFRQTKFTKYKQSRKNNWTFGRHVPKFGASYYPTVKFTIIGYDKSSMSDNTTYSPQNNYTMIQNVRAGRPNALTPMTHANETFARATAPLQTFGSTHINISTVK